jgi:tRNA(His) 5'-end guanylyltransferase
LNTEDALDKKLTQLRKIIDSYENLLNGYERGFDGSLIYTGNVLVGSELAKEIIMLLTPFSDEINLITAKKQEVFNEQRYYTIKSFLSLITNSVYCSAENYRVVAESFFNVLINVGDVIVSSKTFMGDLLKGDKPVEVEESVPL